MMWRASDYGRPGVILVILATVVWMAPVLGWAEAPKKKAPDEARLREAEELTHEYEKMYHT